MKWHGGEDFTYFREELEATWASMDILLFQYFDVTEKYFIED